MTLTPEERILRAKTGAHQLHATHNPKQTTAKGRAAFLAKFEKEVDPGGILSPEERQRRAMHARKAYFCSLALKASQARRKKAGERREKPPVQAAGGEV